MAFVLRWESGALPEVPRPQEEGFDPVQFLGAAQSLLRNARNEADYRNDSGQSLLRSVRDPANATVPGERGGTWSGFRKGWETP